ncbi:MFS transporter [Caldalkalibacillus thermarum TA2.A1]|nr:MFS transporter [Caldalkalibacillus thermarum TA2.A1]
MSIAQFLAMQSWFSFSAVMDIVAAEWRLTPSQSGLIISVFHLGYVVAVIFFSWFLNRVNARYVIGTGALIAGVSGLFFVLVAKGFYSALILRLITGIGLAGIYVPGMRLIADIFLPQKRGRAMGVYVGSLVVGSGFSLFVSGLFVQKFGWQGVILMTAFAALIAAFIAYRLPYQSKTKTTLSISKALLKRIFTRKHLLVNAAYGGHCFELYGMWAWIGPFLIYVFALHGFNEASIQLGNILGSLVIMIGGLATYYGGLISDNIGRLKTINIFITISILCSLLTGWMYAFPIWVLILLVFIYGFAIIADSPVYNTVLTEISDPDTVSLALGVQSVIGFSFTVISPYVFGLFLEWFHWSAAFAVLGIVALLTPLSTFLLRRVVGAF